jgi:hypothetical protein
MKLITTKPLLMKKTELIKPYVMKLSLLWLTKLETTKTPLPPWNQASPITKTSYNKPKSIYNKLNTIMKRLLPLLPPELLKEKLNTPPGLMKITKLQSKSLP